MKLDFFCLILIAFLINNVLRKTIFKSSNRTLIQNLSNVRQIYIFVSIYAVIKSFNFGYSEVFIQFVGIL